MDRGAEVRRCGHCNTLCVARKKITYKTFVKDVGEIVIPEFPMLICMNDRCKAQWISGEGDQMISDAAEKIKAAKQ